MPLEFVARERECAQLVSAFERVASGAGPLAIELRGPSGSGKEQAIKV